MMALHHALKTVPLADSDDVDKALAFENIHQDAVARLDHAFRGLSRSVHFDANFAHEPYGRKVVLAEMSAHRLGQLFFLHEFDEADLRHDATLMTALEALLNVLPYPSQVGKGKADEGGLTGSASDFDALERPVFAGGLLTLLFVFPATVLALGMETFGNAPAVKQPGWAEGVIDVVNLKSRVYSQWVNGNESFFYRGNAQALNESIRKFAEVKDDVRRLILLPGSGRTHSFDRKPIDFDWQLHVPSGIYRAVAKEKHAVMTVYVNSLKPRQPGDPNLQVCRSLLY